MFGFVFKCISRAYPIPLVSRKPRRFSKYDDDTSVVAANDTLRVIRNYVGVSFEQSLRGKKCRAPFLCFSWPCVTKVYSALEGTVTKHTPNVIRPGNTFICCHLALICGTAFPFSFLNAYSFIFTLLYGCYFADSRKSLRTLFCFRTNTHTLSVTRPLVYFCRL